MIRISIRELVGSDTLAGKSHGLRDFSTLLSETDSMADGSTIVLDWKGIEIATASYFGATVIALLRLSVAGTIEKYFVNCNLNRTCLDELKLALEVQGLVSLIGDLTAGGAIKNVQILGILDSAYAETFKAVQLVSKASAAQLVSKHKSEIGRTGWINRLTTLHRLRLVKKEKVGREFIFRAVA